MSKCPDCGSALIAMYLTGVRCSAWPKCAWLQVSDRWAPGRLLGRKHGLR